MWYDATVAATSIATTYPSVFAQTGYAFAPVDKTKSSGWLWSWSLGIPQGATVVVRGENDDRALGHPLGGLPVPVRDLRLRGAPGCLARSAW